MTPLTHPLLTSIGLIDIPLQFMTAPLAYLSFKKALEPRSIITRRTLLLHAILPLFGWTSYLVLRLNTSDPMTLLHTMQQFPLWLHLFWSSSLLSIAAYLLPLFWKYTTTIPIWRESKIGKPMLILMTYLLTQLGIIATGNLFLAPTLIVLGNSMNTGFVLLFFLISARYPQFVSTLIEFEDKYHQSSLETIDITKIEAKIIQFIDEKGFSEPEITLKSCAKQLGITANQLSELLNTHHKKNFKQWLNHHRVHEAKIKLKENPNLTVLAIGLAVGFNSSSTFHAAFKSITGLSPHEYRVK